MRNPLSPVLFYLRNPKKAIPLVAMLSVGAFLVSLLFAIVATMQDSGFALHSMIQRFSVVAPKKAASVPADVQAKVRATAGVKAVVPAYELLTQVTLGVGTSSFRVIALKVADTPAFLDQTGVRLTDGRLPAAGAAELALDERVMRAKGLTLGQLVGNSLDDSEWLKGEFTVVGVLAGDVQVGIASHEFVSSSMEYAGAKESLLVYGQAIRRDETEAGLRTLGSKEVSIVTWGVMKEEMDSRFRGLFVMVGVLEAVVIASAAVAVALTQYVFTLQRLPEFALLMVSGISRRRCVLNSLSGLFWCLGVGWLVGIVMAIAVSSMLEKNLFAPNGLTFGLTWGGMAATLLMPVAVTLVGTVAVVFELRRMNPITVLERRD